MAVKKSQGVGTVAQRRQLLDMGGEAPSCKRQCELLGVARSSTYYKKRATKDEPAREPKFLEDAIEMTSEWMEYYNRERPYSALKNCCV